VIQFINIDIYMKNTEIIELLSELVEIPSISSLEENQKDVLESANYISDLFKKVGFHQKHEYAKGRESKVTGAKNVFKEWPISNTSGHFWPISF